MTIMANYQLPKLFFPLVRIYCKVVLLLLRIAIAGTLKPGEAVQ